jgi:hypothetical protein
MRKALATSLAALAGCSCLIPTHAAELRQRIDGYRAAHELEIVARLDALTRLPSVAARPQRLSRIPHRARCAGDPRRDRRGTAGLR